MRTAAMHMYAWRSSVVPGLTPHSISIPATLKSKAAAAATRLAGARQAEGLLTRAVDLEPFHWPTMVALAFLVLQRGGGGTVARAGALLDRAVKLAGRDCKFRNLKFNTVFPASGICGNTEGSRNGLLVYILRCFREFGSFVCNHTVASKLPS